MVTINGALAIDIHGQVVADTIDGDQYSGDRRRRGLRRRARACRSPQRSLLCLPSTGDVDGELRSRIVPWFDAGAVITTPRHQVDVDRHRVRRRRARGQDGPPARRGARRGRAPGLPRGAARGGRAGVAGAFAPGAGVARVKGSKTASSRGTQGGWVEFRRSCLRNSSHPLGGGRRDARTRPSMPPFSDVSGPGQPICRRWPARCPRSGSRSSRAPAPS